MPSPEHIFQLNAPREPAGPGGTGGLPNDPTGTEDHQLSPLTENHFLEETQTFFLPQKPSTSQVQTLVDHRETRLLAPHARRVFERANRSLESNDNEKNQESSGTYVIGKDDFVWDEELSENGQKLWRWLLDANKIDFLERRANQEGWDLMAAMEEVRSHGLLEECEPGYFRILQRKL